MAALILWLVTILALLGLTSCGALVSILLKGRARTIAADVTLTAATLLFLIATLGGHFSKDFVKERQTKVMAQDFVKKSDLAANGLMEATYIDDLTPPLKVFNDVLGGHGLKTALKIAEKNVQTISDSCPDNAAVAARLAIILHMQGKDVQPVFLEYAKAGGKPDALVHSLNELYQRPVIEHSDQYIQAVQTSLSDEWYKATVLNDIYQISDKAKLTERLAARAIQSKAWAEKLAIYYAITAVMLLAAPLTVLWLRRWPNLATETLPFATSFRRSYACLIGVFMAQLIAGVIIGFILGINSALSHTKIENNLYQFSTLSSTSLAGLVSLLLMFYFFACRPKKLSIGKALTWGSVQLNAVSLTILCLGGFAATLSLNLATRMILKMLPGRAPDVPSVVQKTIIDSIFSADGGMITLLVIFACVMAPVTEELMFRGLLYGWLRSRTGVVGSIILSSLAFAAWHFDPSGFWQYFSIGMVLAAVYERTRNLYIVMAIHSLWNFWVMYMISWLVAH